MNRHDSCMPLSMSLADAFRRMSDIILCEPVRHVVD